MIRTVLSVLGFLVPVVAVLATVDLPDQKPRLPVRIEGEDRLVVLGDDESLPDADHSLSPGDRIVEIDGYANPGRFFLQFYLDGRRVGESVALVVERDDRPVHATAVLVRSLDAALLGINCLVAILIWAFAMLVLFKSRSVRRSVVFLFYWMAMAISLVILVYWPENELGFEGGRWLGLVLNNGLYPLAVALLLHFSLIYPDGWWRRWMRWLTPLIYLPALVLGGLLIGLLSRARASLAVEDVVAYGFVFERVLPTHLATMFLLAMSALAVSYTATDSEDSRQRLKWLFWGFAIGLTPHLMLHELPRALAAAPVLPEHATLLLASFAPVALFISVVRCQMFDVNVVIRRSLVYSVMTLFVVGVFLMLVGLGDWLAVRWWGRSGLGVRLGVVLILAALFEPARNVAQQVVDRIFYRVQYDQRIALMEYSRELARALDLHRLVGALHALLNRFLPVDQAMVLVVEDGLLQEVRPDAAFDADAQPLSLPADDLPELSGAGDSGAFRPQRVPEALWGTELIVPLRIDNRLIGVFALGAKRSGKKFLGEDHRLIRAVAAQTALAFDRARAFSVIQNMNVSLEQKIWERTRQLAIANDRMMQHYEQLQKLNEMKEALTRMVVHDLKNPVSTILLGLEFLERSRLDDLPESARSTLSIISNTALEIQDLISNLLDVYRMEAGELSLSRQPLQMAELFAECARRVEVLAQYRRVRLSWRVSECIEPEADRDLMSRVLVNLLTNAIKHSWRDEVIELTASRCPGDGTTATVDIAVSNSGPIIPAQYQSKVFEKFFQVEGAMPDVIAGTGLGLAFCKLVVEAHGGRIRVESPVPGCEDGARFVLTLPEVAGESRADSKGRPTPPADAVAATEVVGADSGSKTGA